MAEYSNLTAVYSIASYGEMIADRARVDAYARALRQAIRPGSVVVDIGTGVGFFAVLACKLGARRVYAIEPDGSIELARAIAATNGCADRIEFIQQMSTEVALPERADVIVSDLRGILPLFQRHIPSIVDARRRLLAPGGQLIPARDTLWAAVVEDPEGYQRRSNPWNAHPFEIDMSAGQRLVTNTWIKRRAKPEQLLVEPRAWGTLDYANVVEPDLRGDIEWTVDRVGTGHGLLVWFDAVLADGARFSNAPGEPDLVYGSAFFPWTKPVALEAGDRVSVSLSADLVGADYVWRWNARILAGDQPRSAKADFRQSSFFGVPWSRARLARQRSDHVPTLDEDGRIDRLMLSLMDGEHSLAQIADEAMKQFPRRFAEAREALTRASRLSLTYGRRPSNGTIRPGE